MKNRLRSILYPSKSFYNILILLILQNLLILLLSISNFSIQKNVYQQFEYLDDYTIYDTIYKNDDIKCELEELFNKYKNTFNNINYDYAFLYKGYIGEGQNDASLEVSNFVTNNIEYFCKTNKIETEYISNDGIFISKSNQEMIKYENGIPYIYYRNNGLVIEEAKKFQVLGLVDRNNIVIINEDDINQNFDICSRADVFVHLTRKVTNSDKNAISLISSSAYYKDFFIESAMSNLLAIFTIIRKTIITSSVSLFILYLLYIYIRERKRNDIYRVKLIYDELYISILLNKFTDHLIVNIFAYIFCVIIWFIFYYNNLVTLKVLGIFSLIDLLYIVFCLLELLIITTIDYSKFIKFNSEE